MRANPIPIPPSKHFRGEYEYAGSPKAGPVIPVAFEIRSYRESIPNMSIFPIELKHEDHSSDDDNLSEGLSPLTSSSDEDLSEKPRISSPIKQERIDSPNIIGVAKKRFALEKEPKRVDTHSPDRNHYAIKNEVVNPITDFENPYVGALKGDRHLFPKELEKSLPNLEAKNETSDTEEDSISNSSPRSALAPSIGRSSDLELLFDME